MNLLALVDFYDETSLVPLFQTAEELGVSILRPDRNLPPAEKMALGLEMAREAEILLGSRFSDEHLNRAANLRWIHSPMVGVTNLLTPTLVKSKIVLTNGAGMNSIPIAEHVMGMLLAFTRKLPAFHDLKKERTWQQMFDLTELYGQTLGIVGYGSIGREIARRAKAFDMRIIATKRHPSDPALARDPYLAQVYGPAQLPELLAQADFVVLSAALTDETREMIGAAELAAMKPTAYLVNIARGGLVKEEALLAALHSGTIAGAALDVVVQEPLPPESPWWDAPNLLITAHSSFSSPKIRERNITFFCENLRRYVARQPLLNIVDKELGY